MDHLLISGKHKMNWAISIVNPVFGPEILITISPSLSITALEKSTGLSAGLKIVFALLSCV